MQNPFELKARLAGRIDRLGLYLLIILASIGWFYVLYGRIVPSLFAGLSLSVLIACAIRLGERKTLRRREAALRQRIGGEMAIESLLLQSKKSATNNIISWITQTLLLENFVHKANGVLADHESGRVFISCLQKHPSSQATVDDVLAAVRHARRETVDTCIVCATCDFSGQAIQHANELSPRTRLLGRSGLISMAGTAAPATDEQLRTLGKRRRQKFRRELWQKRLLDPGKKQRYLLYGIGLSLMYLLTKQLIYIIPAMICLGLFALCRRKPSGRFTL